MLRLGHRRKRDPRLTTHVALVARAFGAQGMFVSGENDEALIRSINKVVASWGGEFRVEHITSWRKFLDNWRSAGKSVHLTMYGSDVRSVIDEVRSCDTDLLLIVGSQKVPGELYQIADWNVSITNQPHSEVSALAVFMHLLSEGAEFDLEFPSARIRVVPSTRKKKVIKADPRHPSF